MSDTGFRDEDPWHSYINLVFCVMCDGCHDKIEIDWSLVNDVGNDDFLRQCVAAAERAPKEGWKHLGGSRFGCRRCCAGGVK
jgi:hypothetical protein